ncbi:MAG: ribosomal protein S18-alanine N-acetyltransferase [Lachnospiraceae bacterium]|nr:ribosomal protein S18-alanine N-acetyltransferase [Lachnospiraceae bacterium]
MSLEIRRLQAEDIPHLLPMEQEAFSSPWSERNFKELLDKETYLYLVALSEGIPVGICGMIMVCGEGDIDKVLVDFGHRGQGIGKALLQELIRQGQRQGIADFTLEVRVSNTPAIRLYEQEGFVSEGIRPGFYDKPKEDAMIMWKRSG